MHIDLFSFSLQDCAKDKRKRRPNMHMVWEALEKIVKDRQQKEHLGEADFFAPEAAAAESDLIGVAAACQEHQVTVGRL